MKAIGKSLTRSKAWKALAAHHKVLGRDHAGTRDSAGVTADALGRAEEAKALRERYGVTPPENPHSS